MALSYNLGYQESISVHPTRRRNFAGKPYSNFPNIWEWLILHITHFVRPYHNDGTQNCRYNARYRLYQLDHAAILHVRQQAAQSLHIMWNSSSSGLPEHEYLYQYNGQYFIVEGLEVLVFIRPGLVLYVYIARVAQAGKDSWAPLPDAWSSSQTIFSSWSRCGFRWWCPFFISRSWLLMVMTIIPNARSFFSCCISW